LRAHKLPTPVHLLQVVNKVALQMGCTNSGPQDLDAIAWAVHQLLDKKLSCSPYLELHVDTW